MKKNIVFGLIGLAFALCSCGGSDSASDLTDLGLRGKVKNVTERRFHALTEPDGSVKKGVFFRGEDEWDYTESFDKRGKYQVIAYLDRDGDTVATNVYEYDKEGNLLFKRFLEEGKALKMSSKYVYDMLGRVKVVYELDEEDLMMHTSNTEYNDENMIETCTTIDNKGAFFSQTVTQKNRRGDVTDFKYINNERELVNWRKETHDEEGKMTAMAVLTPDEKVIFKVKCSYNLQGDMVTMVPTSEEAEFMSESYTYEYDKKSNWVKRIQYVGDSAVSVTEREIEYY